MSGFRQCLLTSIVMLITWAGLATRALAGEGAWFVEKLNDNKPWDRLAESPLAIRVEGRLSSSGGGQFRLQNCDARFVVDSAKLKFIPPKSVVEVKGRFKKDGAKLEFHVEEIKQEPSDADEFEKRASKRRPTVEDWIALAEWTNERAVFYDDAELKEKAAKAYANAIEVEYKSLKPSDAEGRLQLAKKHESYHLPDRRRLELIHEGLQLRWHAEQKSNPPDLAAWQKFADRLPAQLPGANSRLPQPLPDLAQKYEQDPYNLYEQADDARRKELHRLFFIAVTRDILSRSLAEDGGNGDKVADLIDQRIPEEHGLAESYRGKKLDYQLSHIKTATRSEVETLVKAFQARGLQKQARKSVVDWIQSHESTLKSDGVIGLLRLADEYQTMLGDEPHAVECLQEAYRLDPQYEEITTRFQSLGYHLQGSRWQKTNPSAAASISAADAVPTTIQVGMSATDVRKFLGEPRSVARFATARGLTEIWNFGVSAGNGIVIRMEKSFRDTEPKVTRFK